CVICEELTGMLVLVLAVFAVSVTLLAVTVKLPAVLKVTLKAFVPATSAALAGNVALASLEVIFTVSVTVLIKFQFASTALTVTLKLLNVLSVVGVPLLPEALPGDAVSPGASTCILTKAATPTVTLALVFAPSVPAASLAVTVRVPADL